MVFVADSQKEMVDQNIESLNNMRENLTVNNINPDDTPVVFQYNKRDIPGVRSIEELNNELNKDNAPYFEAVAAEGKGVQETFDKIKKLLIQHISKKHKVDIEAPAEAVTSGVHPAGTAPPLQSMEESITVPKAAAPPAPPSWDRADPVTPSKPQTEERPAASFEPPPQPREEERPLAPVSLDVTELVSVVNDLGRVMKEMHVTFKDMLNKQTKISSELFELKQIFLETKEKNGFKKIFK